MNKKYVIRLTEEERVGLTRLVNTGKVAAGKRRHAGILLKADEIRLVSTTSMSGMGRPNCSCSPSRWASGVMWR